MNARRVGLVEIVVVCAIVAAAAAIVVPALSQARSDTDKQKALTCLSNLRQLGLGILMYTQDFDEHYPSGANYYGSGSGWAQQIWPYVKSSAVYHCPCDTGKGDAISYGYNSNFVRLTGYVPSAPMGQKLSALASPAYTVMLFEVANNSDGASQGYSLKNPARPDIHKTGKRIAPWDGCSPAGRGLGSYPGELSGMGAPPVKGAPPLSYATGLMSGSDADSPDFAPARHGGISFYVFADGHAKGDAPSAISAGKNNLDPGSPGGADKAASTSVCGHGSLDATFSLF